MREILNKALLTEYLDRYQIPALFECSELPFRLYEYAPGEIVNLLRPEEEYFKFLVDGTLDAYLILPSGAKHMIHRYNHFCVLGYMEFSGRQLPGQCLEVVETVRTIELPMALLHEKAGNDPTFLGFLLREMSFILSFCLPMHPEFDSLKDALLYHIRHTRPDHCIHSVEETAARLNCSRRQLQRVLKQLTEAHILIKIGRGEYRLK